MGLFGKSKKTTDDLPKFDVGAPGSDSGASGQDMPMSKEVELVTSVKNEFSIIISGVLRQSQKKLQETYESLGKVESTLHNLKIYQDSLKSKAEMLEGKLLYMRGGSQETIEQDLAEEEQNVILYIKNVANHLSSTIIELRDLRRLLSKVSVVPADPQLPPLESGREFGAKVVEMVHKVQNELDDMQNNFMEIYDLEAEVARVGQEHGINFPQDQQAQSQQGQQQAQPAQGQAPVPQPQQTQQFPQ